MEHQSPAGLNYKVIIKDSIFVQVKCVVNSEAQSVLRKLSSMTPQRSQLIVGPQFRQNDEAGLSPMGH